MTSANASWTAWFVPGVKSVKNDLTVKERPEAVGKRFARFGSKRLSHRNRMPHIHLQGGSVMKKLIVPFMFAMILGVGMASLSFAAGDMAAPGTRRSKGTC